MVADAEEFRSNTSSYIYPLERYMKVRPTREVNIETLQLDEEDSISKSRGKPYEKIRNIIKSAERELDSIVSNMTTPKEENKAITLQEPQYLDENFDQKRYIQELVNAKFKGLKIIEKNTKVSKLRNKNILDAHKSDDDVNKIGQQPDSSRVLPNRNYIPETNISNVQVVKHNPSQTLAYKRLEKVVASSIEITPEESIKKIDPLFMEDLLKLQNKNSQVLEVKSADRDEVQNEIIQPPLHKKLAVQVMPNLNIRTQLMEQKIPSMDIYPNDKNNILPVRIKNVGLIEFKHLDKKVQITDVEEIDKKIDLPSNASDLDNPTLVQLPTQAYAGTPTQPPIQLQEDFSFFIQGNRQQRPNQMPGSKKSQRMAIIDDKYYRTASGWTDFGIQPSQPGASSHMFLNKSNTAHSFGSRRSNKNISTIKKYAYPEIQKIYTSKKPAQKKTFASIPSTSGVSYPSVGTFLHHDNKSDGNYKSSLQYIPYSKLTVGGYNADEVEKQMANTAKKSKDTGRAVVGDSFPPGVTNFEFLENLQEESIIAEGSENSISTKTTVKSSDDFGSEHTDKSPTQTDVENNEGIDTGSEQKSDYADDFDEDVSLERFKVDDEPLSAKDNKTSKKVVKQVISETKRPVMLNLKDQIEVIDFIHNIETMDHSTQSSLEKYLEFKETQTSPPEPQESHKSPEKNKNIKQKIDVATMTLEDMLEFQRGLSLFNSKFLADQLIESTNEQKENIIDEINKDVKDTSNFGIYSIQKDTQTSPLKTSHMMTSPAKVVSRLLSPIFKESKRDAQTSPYHLNTTPSELQQDSDPIVDIPINIPCSPKVVLTNLNAAARPSRSENLHTSHKADTFKEKGKKSESQSYPRKFTHESSDIYTDVSESSESHSLGEINLKIIRRKLVTIKSSSNSGTYSNSNSFAASSSSDVNLNSTLGKRSEGEISVGQILEKV